MKIFSRSRISFHALIVAAILLVGLAIRWINLTNPPLDFHATRQLRGAVIARGMYYQLAGYQDAPERRAAVRMWQQEAKVYEPPLLEGIVALTYLALGKEHLWIARVYTTLFWVLGGLVLYLLIRRMGHPFLASLLSLAFYLFAPYGVFASRSFQPDPFMVMWIIMALYAIWRWTEERRWKWAILTGSLIGVAILVKVFALALLLPAVVILIASSNRLSKVLRDKQVWTILALCALIPASYYLFMIGQRSLGFFPFGHSRFGIFS